MQSGPGEVQLDRADIRAWCVVQVAKQNVRQKGNIFDLSKLVYIALTFNTFIRTAKLTIKKRFKSAVVVDF